MASMGASTGASTGAVPAWASAGPAARASRDATDQDTQHRYHYYLTPRSVSGAELQEPSLEELARVITAGACIESSFKRGKGEAGMDEYQVRTWQGWHHHIALSLLAVWFLIGETHRGQSFTPALTLPQVRYGLSLLLLEVYCTPSIDYKQLPENLSRKGFVPIRGSPHSVT